VLLFVNIVAFCCQHQKYKNIETDNSPATLPFATDRIGQDPRDRNCSPRPLVVAFEVRKALAAGKRHRIRKRASFNFVPCPPDANLVQSDRRGNTPEVDPKTGQKIVPYSVPFKLDSMANMGYIDPQSTERISLELL